MVIIDLLVMLLNVIFIVILYSALIYKALTFVHGFACLLVFVLLI